MKSGKKVAIFDIDGTIFRSSLLIELVDALIHEGIFPASARKIYAKAYQNWLDRKGEYEEYIMAVVKAFMKHIRGVQYKDFQPIAKKVVLFHHNRVYRFTRDLIRELKQKGYYLLAISQSPMEVVQEFAKQAGFNKMYGRVYEVGKNGRFTGKMLYLNLMTDKAKVLRRAVEKENLSMKGSVAVGDTEGDISMLSVVENPICFNPNKNLYTHAKRKKWRVVVERKDMIYKL
jgi:HAD superfamily hydrolase (TIGR01490 family)